MIRSSFRPLTLAALLAMALPLAAQYYPAGRAPHLGPLFDKGVARYTTPEIALELMKSSGTVAGLEVALPASKDPRAAKSYDFSPFDLLAARSVDGYFHLGDLNLRLRTVGNEHWQSYSTAHERHAVIPLAPEPGELERDNLAPTFAADFPLQATRIWTVEGGHLVLRFTLHNPGTRAIEIGALGIPLVFNNVLTGRSLEEAHALANFSDPSIALDGGYVQVTRLDGKGPALVVVPDGKTPFEAYRLLENAPRHEKSGEDAVPFEEKTPRQQTFEGFYEWMTSSLAYGQNEWKGVQEWNPATSFTLAPGETRTIGLRFLVADSIRDIEKTLIAAERPVAVGIPGYVLPKDIDAPLYLHAAQPMRSIVAEPAGAIAITANGTTEHGWLRYTLRGKQWGRARIVVSYADGSTESIHYRVTKPAADAVDDLGHFLFTKQWFDKKDDPFHRAPSIISYDREANAQVLQDQRVWIAGLSDEGGAGSWLAAAMQEYARPEKKQVEQLEQFIDGVVWGHLQVSDGPQKYGVRRSLFYYDPEHMPAGYYDSKIDWSTWESWKKDDAAGVWRSYNYPHVVAAYWALYRIARNHPGMATHHAADWYLNQAYETILAMTHFAEGQASLGQMEGTVFVKVLDDLRHEGETAKADKLEAAMRARAEGWRQQAYPFGSEMPWDSTGQEEVYDWCQRFGFADKAQVTIDAITGYMPTIPNWGYNGNARRYWDFLYGGKYPRIERQMHHYGSGMNAIPLLDAYRHAPEDLYLLRVGYGGTMGALTNIDEEGFASAAFHSYPDKMAFDPYSGDYGPNFLGHALAVGSFLTHDAEFGWLAFGGNVKEEGETVVLAPRDAMRQRVFVAPISAWLTLDAGRFASVRYNTKTGAVDVQLDVADSFTPKAYLRIEATTAKGKLLQPTEKLAQERAAYAIALGKTLTTVHLVATDAAKK
jgi:hypothetical protein